MSAQVIPIRKCLEVLIMQARAEKKWLWCRYQDLWFSPDELAREKLTGSALWDANNWALRDPEEMLEAAALKAAKAMEIYNALAERVDPSPTAAVANVTRVAKHLSFLQ